MASSSLSPEDFLYVAELVRQRAAIVLEAGKEYLVDARMRPLLRIFHCATVAELVERARDGRDTPLQQAIVEAMTTNETHFFRDRQFFEALQEGVFPALIEARRAERALSMWCAACSSGQEPYSVLMLLREHFPQLRDWKITFIVSDISRLMLERTRLGRYSQLEVNRGLPASLLVKYFRREGLEWQIADELRQALDIRQINLADRWPPMPRLDIVFLRNVLIYFDVETKKAVMQRVSRDLREDGLVFLGGSETMFGIDETYNRSPFTRASCYSRKEPVQ